VLSGSDHTEERQEEPTAGQLHALLNEELPRLRAFARLRMGAELRACESVSDIVQTVCLELLRSEDTFEWRGRDSFRHWLFVTALNKIRQRLRRYRVRGRRVERWSDVDQLRLSECYGRVAQPLQTLASKEAIASLEAAFDALPEHYAEIITLRRVVGLSYETIAAERGSTQAAVRVLLHRALARLGTLLDQEAG
jgi:RNA polymerase sigma factor (sigma-70 family)